MGLPRRTASKQLTPGTARRPSRLQDRHRPIHPCASHKGVTRIMTTPEDLRNVAVLGHKGSGKTSLVEAALFVAKVTPKLGKAGDRASGLDDSPEERAHITTLETRPVTLRWNTKKINLVDTPGEASFMADARLALSACDSAIVCVSARDG